MLTFTKRSLLAAGAAALAVSSLGFAGSAAAEPKTIAIAQFGKHPQLDLVTETFRDELAKRGYGPDEVVFVENQVNFEAPLIPQMLTNLRGSNPVLILTITTPVTQVARQLLDGAGIPVVFAAVTDPVAAQLTPSWEQAGPFITGSSDLQDLDAVAAFTRKLFPDAKTLAFPYNPGEDNDTATLAVLQKAAPAYGFTVLPLGVDNTNDIPIRIQSLAGKADVMYVPASNLLQPAMPAIAAAAQNIKLPIVNSSQAEVVAGLVPASFEVDYGQVGRNAAALAAEILEGKPVDQIPPVKPTYADHRALINKAVMEQLGKPVPADLADCNCFTK